MVCTNALVSSYLSTLPRTSVKAAVRSEMVQDEDDSVSSLSSLLFRVVLILLLELMEVVSFFRVRLQSPMARMDRNLSFKVYGFWYSSQLKAERYKSFSMALAAWYVSTDDDDSDSDEEEEEDSDTDSES